MLPQHPVDAVEDCGGSQSLGVVWVPPQEGESGKERLCLLNTTTLTDSPSQKLLKQAGGFLSLCCLFPSDPLYQHLHQNRGEGVLRPGGTGPPVAELGEEGGE